MKWDEQAICRAVKERHYAYVGRVRELMPVEDQLEKEQERDQKTSDNLAAAICAVELAGGDATNLIAQRASLAQPLEDRGRALKSVQDELATLREALKWSGMAHDGMHWLCFAESNLRTKGYALKD